LFTDFGFGLESVKFTSEREAAPRYYRKWLWAEIGKREREGNYRKWLWAEIGKGGEGEKKKGAEGPLLWFYV